MDQENGVQQRTLLGHSRMVTVLSVLHDRDSGASHERRQWIQGDQG